MAALPCCTEGTWKRSAAPRVDWPVYPRRAEHNTIAEGGNRRWSLARAWVKIGNRTKFPGPVSRRSGTSAGGTDSRQSERKGRVLGLRRGQSWDFKDVLPTAWPWGRRLPARPSFAVEGESRAALRRAGQSDRHSGSGIGRVLGSSLAARQRDREPRRRCGFDRGRPAASAGQDRCDRRRDAVADPDGLGSRRAAGLFHGLRAEPARRGSPAADARALLKERIQHTNRIRGLLGGQGVRDYNPLRRDRFQRLEALRTGEGRELPPLLKAEIRRELDRMVTTQLAAVERARDALIRTDAEERNNPAALLLKLKGLGPEFASLLWLESLFRSFGNRRQVAAYSGLAPSPWQSGGVERDQGISKSGNRRQRKTMIELAWFWLRHQPDSALSRWFQTRVGAAKGRIRRIAIVALARKLLVALWRYVTQGVVPEGAVFKTA